ncbi:hypothetical protein ACX93W_05625 [Paenibacillus sp. CAU 1782]
MTVAIKSMLRRAGTRPAAVLACAILLVLTSGCLYPKENSQSAPPKEAVRNIQSAIDQYFSEQGLLPIINASQDVPLYEKFRLDFKKLQGKGYISSIPAAAFENGGNYYFLIIDEESKPLIRLQDILAFQKVNDLQKQVNTYSSANGKLPLSDTLYPGFFGIDYGVLGIKQPVITSMFSGGALQAMLDEEGTVYIDYGIDIMQRLQREEDISLWQDGDLRRLLIDNTEFVPVKSPAYQLNEDGEPVAVNN